MRGAVGLYRVWVSSILALLGCLAAAVPAVAKCQLQQVAQLPAVVTDYRILVPVEIDGRPSMMILDTGAAKSLLFRDAARRLGLPERSVGGGFRMSGVGGETTVGTALVSTFTLGQSTLRNLPMLVAGERQMDRESVVGLLGQDFLSRFDMEVDLAHQAVRLLQPVDCHGDQVVYWAGAYSQVRIEPDVSLYSHTTARVQLNGQAIDAYLDTGSPFSVVTLSAAARARVTPDSPKAEKAGSSFGIGGHVSPVWTATFDTFAIGGETIKNAKIKMSDMFSHNTYMETGSILPQRETDLPSMLLGFDFFRAHRVLIANSQGMIYFTYDGGPVFDTAQRSAQGSVARVPIGASPDSEASGARAPPPPKTP